MAIKHGEWHSHLGERNTVNDDVWMAADELTGPTQNEDGEKDEIFPRLIPTGDDGSTYDWMGGATDEM